jgi:hypothetical protein
MTRRKSQEQAKKNQQQAEKDGGNSTRLSNAFKSLFGGGSFA